MRRRSWPSDLSGLKYSKLLPLVLGLLVLGGCSDYPSHEVFDTKVVKDVTPEPDKDVVPESEDDNPYQIGSTWDRTPIEPKAHYPYQILMMNRTNLGDVGVGVYLGTVNGKHIVMTAAHLFPELESCEYDVSFGIEDKEGFHYFPCGGWSFKMYENDIMFFELSPNFADLNLLIPVEVSKKTIKRELPLTLLSVQRDPVESSIHWHIDQSKECMVLSDEIKNLEDPDTLKPSGISSWSVAMGCDGMHGDSGSPVFDKEFKLLGLLWTGKYPKDGSSRDIFTKDEDKIWSSFNYFIPAVQIRNELIDYKNNTTLATEDKEMLGLILDGFF